MVESAAAILHVVGLGLEGAAGLAPAVLRIVQSAQLLVGSDRHLAAFPDHPGQRLVLGDLGAALGQLQQVLQCPAGDSAPAYPSDDYPSDYPSARAETTAVVLTSGDPLFFGLGRLLLEQLPPEQLVFHPQPSSVQLAFSRLKRPWQGAALVSIHGRRVEPLIPLLHQGRRDIAVLTDPLHSPGAIAQLILSLGLPISYRCWVCENLGGTEERIQDYSPEELTAVRCASLTLLVLIPEPLAPPGPLPLLGIDDRQFASFDDRPGLMTKRPLRSLILGELALGANQVIWDIGAGTGSVSVEIARLCPSSHIYAIEKTAAGQALIRQNCDRFATANVTPVAGIAPIALAPLPAPDRVFIGGSGGNLTAVLDHCAEQLRPGGRLVLAIATLETLAQAQQWCRQQHWQVDLMQVQLAKGAAIAQLTRWSPLNPVTLLTTRPKP